MRKLFVVLVLMLLPVVASAEMLTLAIGNRWVRPMGGQVQIYQEKQMVFLGRFILPAKGTVKLVTEVERTAARQSDIRGFIGVQVGF